MTMENLCETVGKRVRCLKTGLHGKITALENIEENLVFEITFKDKSKGTYPADLELLKEFDIVPVV